MTMQFECENNSSVCGEDIYSISGATSSVSISKWRSNRQISVNLRWNAEQATDTGSIP